MVKTVFGKIIRGASLGCVMFTVTLLIIDIVFDGSLAALSHQYDRIIAGAVFVGVGLTLSSLIYEIDNIQFALRTLIGLAVDLFILIAGYFISGGIPYGSGFGIGAIFFFIEMGVGALFWLANFIYFLKETAKLRKSLTDKSIHDI